MEILFSFCLYEEGEDYGVDQIHGEQVISLQWFLNCKANIVNKYGFLNYKGNKMVLSDHINTFLVKEALGNRSLFASQRGQKQLPPSSASYYTFTGMVSNRVQNHEMY